MWTPANEWGPALQEHRSQTYFVHQGEERASNVHIQPTTHGEETHISDNQFTYNTLNNTYTSNEDSYI